ncbi:MAG: alpha/beta hydrolase [Chitinophagaceae bacterium]|nr:alpha/beta hydrolase [Chitinophagaceae bacterium]
MKFIQFNDNKTGEEINIAYSDYGKGQPVVLIHGWPLSREMWEYQLEDLVNGGYRVIKYDRRGFGKSSKPWTGYDYDTLADDLHQLMVQLDLHDTVLAGFSMGGGEVVRYIGKYGEDRVRRIALISSIIPYLLKNDSNPDGVDAKVFEEMIEGVKADRIGFIDEFGKKFFGIGFLNKPVSTPLLQYYTQLASHATQHSTVECIRSFSRTDFRNDVTKITVPALIIHGDSDKIVPHEVSSKRTAEMLPHAELVVYAGAPHGLFYTHRDLLNTGLLNFFAGKKQVEPVPEDDEILSMPF